MQVSKIKFCYKYADNVILMKKVYKYKSRV